MSQEEIDYKAVAESTQRDLEQARLEIVKLRHMPWLRVNLRQVNGYIRDNYLVCMFVVMVLYYVASFLVEWKKASKYV